MNQKSIKNLTKLGFWRLLGRLVELLEESWAHLGSKSQQVIKKLVRWTPLAPPSWIQNPTKLDPSWAKLGASWAKLVPRCAMLEHLEAMLDHLAAILEPD